MSAIPRQHTSDRVFRRCFVIAIRHCLGLVAAAVLFGAQPGDVLSEIYEEDVVVITSTWDFSHFDCGCPPCHEPCRREDSAYFDCDLIFIFDPPLGHALVTPAGALALGDVPIDSVESVPLEGYDEAIAASINEEFQVNRTYVIRTREGTYALIRPTLVNEFEGGFTFRVKYQDDGSGIFRSGTAITEARTWSKLKALFFSE